MSIPVRLLAGMVLIVLSFYTFAQSAADASPGDDAAAHEEEPKVLQPIQVTGYHIKRMDIEGPAPVMVFSRTQLEQAGVNTLQEFAAKLPINFPEELGTLEAIGAASFDLRGIGVDTTLTLVNGLRIAPYAQLAENSVDVNSIPLSAIERIEILTDGASAIYGADAIAGVVNIILRTRFDGMEFSAGYGDSQHGGGRELLADLVVGHDTGRGSILFSFSAYDRDPQLSKDRDWSSDLDYSDIGGPNVRSSFSSPPGFLRYDYVYTVPDPACGEDPVLSSVGDGYFGGEYGQGCRFNIQQIAEQYPGLGRFGATLSGRYDFSAKLSLFGDLLFSDVQGTFNLAPAPMYGSPEIETWTGFPYAPADHPDNPFGAEGELFYRALDLGSRKLVNDAISYRAVLGLEGTWKAWDWTVSGLHSQNRVEKHFDNLVPVTRFQLALLGLGGPNGDQWYNPFGFEPQNDPDLKDWLTTTAELSDKTAETSVDVLFTRLFGNLPGGPAGVAIGLQYREQELDQWADDALQSGDLGFRHVPISADRNIASAYLELKLPLLDNLEAQLALRYENYSDFGSDTNPKIALRWQTSPSLMFRASYSTSFKPPSFYELYQPPNEDWGWYRDVVRCAHTGEEADCDWWLYRTHGSGNPDLQPEEGKSWFTGMVWTPEFLRGFEFQLDLWKFSHEERIEWLWGQLVLDEGGDFGIVREPPAADGTPGRIVLVNETFVNTDVLETRGFDTTIRYHWSTANAGDFRIGLMHTYVDEWLMTDSIDQDVLDWGNMAGGYGFSIPIPHNRANLNFSWNRGNHAASANVDYTGSYEHYRNLWVDGEETGQPLNISSHSTMDLQYRYTFDNLNRAELLLGCNNVLDRDPPLAYLPFNEPFHDGRGRFFYFRWRQPVW
jgi:outer membrane receptor protein involved in Fe transport